MRLEFFAKEVAEEGRLFAAGVGGERVDGEGGEEGCGGGEMRGEGGEVVGDYGRGGLEGCPGGINDGLNSHKRWEVKDNQGGWS